MRWLLFFAALPAFAYTVGGSITGFVAPSATYLVLRLNNKTSKLIPANATYYQFSTSIVAGATYAVSVGIQPAGMRCTIANASGTSIVNVTNANITCVKTQSATLMWTLPTQNTDGTPLTDLTNFILYYGTDSTFTTSTTRLLPASTLMTTVNNLVPNNTYYFAIASVSASGGIGQKSNAASIKL